MTQTKSHKRIEVICEVCEKEFWVYTSRLAKLAEYLQRNKD